MLDEWTFFLKEEDKAALVPQPVVENNTYAHVTMDWPQSVYYAWVLYGAVSFQLGLYWIQKFYMNNWYGLATDYKSGNPTGFTNYGLGETINRLVLLCMWSVTALFWVLTNVQAEGMYWFFTIWARFLHFVDVLRLITVTVFKTIGVFTDAKTDYWIDDGTNLSTGFATKSLGPFLDAKLHRGVMKHRDSVAARVQLLGSQFFQLCENLHFGRSFSTAAGWPSSL